MRSARALLLIRLIMLVTRLSNAVPGLRILCVSGYLDESSRVDFSKTGSEFLEKPFTCSVLAARIRGIPDSDS